LLLIICLDWWVYYNAKKAFICFSV
jgi:hypothetical protein